VISFGLRDFMCFVVVRGTGAVMGALSGEISATGFATHHF